MIRARTKGHNLNKLKRWRFQVCLFGSSPFIQNFTWDISIDIIGAFFVWAVTVTHSCSPTLLKIVGKSSRQFLFNTPKHNKVTVDGLVLESTSHDAISWTGIWRILFRN